MNVHEQTAIDAAQLREQIQRVQTQLDGPSGQMPHLRTGLQRELEELEQQLTQLTRPVLSSADPEPYAVSTDPGAELGL